MIDRSQKSAEAVRSEIHARPLVIGTPTDVRATHHIVVKDWDARLPT